MQLLVGMEPGKADETCAMIIELEKEETAILDKINQGNHNFLTIVGGHVGQLQLVSLGPVHSNTPVMPPGISSSVHTGSPGALSNTLAQAKKSDDQQRVSTMRCCLSNDDFDEKEVASLATDGSMAVDIPDLQAKEVDMVCRPLLPLQNMLMVTHDDISAPSLNRSDKPLPSSVGIF